LSAFLTEDADLLLYGLTGHADFGADWDLEFRVGAIEADTNAIEARMSAWQGILANITVTTVEDLVDGDTSSVEALFDDVGVDGEISLREAVQAANNTPGHVAITWLLMRVWVV